jgi:hypothetical protein
MTCRCTAFVLILSMVTAASAQSVDTSTPRAAARSLTAAITRADADAVRQLIVVDNDPAQQLVGAYANFILAGKRLSESVRKRYPGTTDPFAAGGIAPEDAASIDAAAVSVDGDMATLKIQGRARPLKLRRIGGAWKVVISEEPATQTPRQRADQVGLVQGLADAMNSSSDDISAGKFRDVEDARNAVKERLGAVAARAIQSNPPTSRPTTQAGE